MYVYGLAADADNAGISGPREPLPYACLSDTFTSSQQGRGGPSRGFSLPWFLIPWFLVAVTTTSLLPQAATAIPQGRESAALMSAASLKSLSQPPNQNTRMLDSRGSAAADRYETPSPAVNGVSAHSKNHPSHPAPDRDRQMATTGLFSSWSAWTPCSRKCRQRRHRCLGGDCRAVDRLVEKRSCWRSSSRRRERCKVRRHWLKGDRQRDRKRKNWKSKRGRNRKSDARQEGGKATGKDDYGSDEEEPVGDEVESVDNLDDDALQKVVYDLLYYDWTQWTTCTRSCKRRRFRVCALRRFCKNTVLMEERPCYVAGSECERRHAFGDNDKPVIVSSSSKEERPGRRRNKKRPKKTPPQPAPPMEKWEPSLCGMRDPAMDATPRIVGGTLSRRGAWPWQVAILTRPYEEQYCGGVLISPYHVLTAAHCVRRGNRKRRIIVRVGEFDLGKKEGNEQDLRVAADYVHDNFNLDTIDSDIAILKLRTPVRQSSTIGFACVPGADARLPVGTRCFAVGWGKVRETHLFGTDKLRQAEVPLVDDGQCQRAFEYEITPSQMCAGYAGGGVDTCAGDSGGPLMCLMNRGGAGGQPRWHVYGVTSFGEGCGDRGKYGIYTRVSNFTQWILQTTGRGSGGGGGGGGGASARSERLKL